MPEPAHPARGTLGRRPRNSGGIWVLAALGVLLAGAFWFWFDANFERRLREAPVGASPRARHNPFLAAERFLVRVGADARGSEGHGLLRGLPDTADMIIVDGLPALNPTRRAQLRDWIAAGGQLLVEAIEVQDDDDAPRPEAFLGTIGVALRYDDDAYDDDEAVAELQVDGHPRPVRVGFDPRWYLEDLDGRAVGAATAGDRVRLLQYGIGDGLLFVVSDSTWLRNHDIGRHDHALLLALLAADRGTIWLLHDASTPGLAALLWRAAPAAIVSVTLLLAMLSWSLGARLGPLLPAPGTGRRDLLEHLQAAGDFTWRLGRGGLLVQRTRQRVEHQWLQRHAPLRELGDGDRARRIAELSGLAPADVRAALYEPVGDAARLLAITATLQRLARTRPAHTYGRRTDGRTTHGPA